MFIQVILGGIILTLAYIAIFYKLFKDFPVSRILTTYFIGSLIISGGILVLTQEFFEGFTIFGWFFIAVGLMLIGIDIHSTYEYYLLRKNTAKVVERFVTGTVKTKNSSTNIRTVNNNITSSENYHTVIKLDSPDSYDNFINFYDYNTFMTVSEGERVNLKNVRKLDKNENILESTYWIV